MGFVERRFPWLVSVGLHGLLAVLLLVNWPVSQRTVVEPPSIRAVVLQKNVTTHAQPKPVQQEKPVKQEKPIALPKPEPTPTPRTVPKPHEVVKPKPKVSAVKPKPRFTNIAQPDLAAQIAQENIAMAKQQEAAQAMTAKQQKAEASAQQMEQDQETAAAVAAIKSALSAKWQRPPSARNNMEVLLQIQLMPGGDVVSVTILKSSGDKALDGSAVTAVENASPLPVPSGELFNQFRKFTLRFRPEDLRL